MNKPRRSGSPTPRRSSRPQPRQTKNGRRSSGPGDFWGRAAAAEADAAGNGGGGNGGGNGGAGGPAVERIRPTPDPTALPRSLGDPPLGPNPEAGQALLGAVYEEAVRAATALAAASGLLEGLADED
jgi:hypothetical protein